MTINRAVNTAVEFCKEEFIPSKYTVKTTALYVLGGCLSGKIFGFVSPMHGAIYLTSSKVAYVAINRIAYHIHQIASKTTNALSRKIAPAFSSYYSKQESSFPGYVKSGRYLVSSWMDSFRNSLRFIRGLPLGYTNIYLSHHVANTVVLSLLGMQPIAYRTAMKVVFSSTALTILADSFIDFAIAEARRIGEDD